MTVTASEAGRLRWDSLYERVSQELERQRLKWGQQNHWADHWYLIVSEEFGEIAQALTERNADQAQTEIVETIACLVQLWAAIRQDAQEAARRDQ